jgi:hypothetical protein
MALAAAAGIAGPGGVCLGDPCDGVWSAGNALRGVNGAVKDSAFATVNGVNSVYLLTNGTVAGSTVGKGVWRFDGTNFFPMPLPGDVFASSVYTIAVYNNVVYVGGAFHTCGGQAANGLARWNGTQWVPVSGLLDPQANIFANVFDLVVFNNELYIAGDFNISGIPGVKNLARYNGTFMNAVGGFNDFTARKLAINGGGVVVSGSFTHAGPVAADHIARWNGTSWAALGTGIGSYVNDMSTLNGDLYVGGTDVLGTADLAVWNGSTWSAINLPDYGNGGSTVDDLIIFNSTLYVAGSFDQPNPYNYTGIMSIEGNSRILRGGVDGCTDNDESAQTMFILNGALYLGGSFQDVNNVPAESLARYNSGNATWTAVGPAASSGDSELLTCSVFEGALVVGGYTRVLGGTEVNGIGRTYDGVTFSPMGHGFDGGVYVGEVRDTVVHNGELYAVGNFYSSYTTLLNNVARWDGSEWRAVGQAGATGVGSTSYLEDHFGNALAACSTPQGLVVAGTFSTAGGQPANSVALWNGVSWDNLGGGLLDSGNGPALIWSVAWHDGQLFAGGFPEKTSGGAALNSVARWTGTQWVDAGAGIADGVVKLYEKDGELYALGRTVVVPNSQWRVYRWTGAAWTAVSEASIGGVVWSLFDHDGDLMVGGSLPDAGTFPNLARLGEDGNQFQFMPELDMTVRDGVNWNGRIAVVGEHGTIDQNGTKSVSTGVAVWTPGKPTFTDQPDQQMICDRQDAIFIVEAVSSNALAYQWKRNNVALNDGATPQGSTIVGAHLPILRVQQATYQDEGIYTCVATNACTSVASDGARLIIGGCSCGPADLGRQGGVPGADGVLDNNDFVVFIDLFFQGNPGADFGQQGGIAPGDGAFDNNDFVVFIDLFFAGCP